MNYDARTRITSGDCDPDCDFQQTTIPKECMKHINVGVDDPIDWTKGKDEFGTYLKIRKYLKDDSVMLEISPLALEHTMETKAVIDFYEKRIEKLKTRLLN